VAKATKTWLKNDQNMSFCENIITEDDVLVIEK